MSPDIIGFVTRADAGLVKPRSASRSITPEHGGVAVHWGGGGSPPSTHDGCLALWKRWQTFHMSDGWAGLPNGGSDIAYTGGYCNHGYAFAGRGIGIRSGAQGTKVGNDHYYSFVWLGGSGGRPNSLAYSALGWWIVQARAAGAGTEVRPHSWFKSTGCPGPDLRDFASDHHNKPLLEDDMPLSDSDVDRVATAVVSRVLTDSGDYADPPGLGRQIQLIRATVNSTLKAVNSLDEIDSQKLAADIAAELEAEGIPKATAAEFARLLGG